MSYEKNRAHGVDFNPPFSWMRDSPATLKVESPMGPDTCFRNLPQIGDSISHEVHHETSRALRSWKSELLHLCFIFLDCLFFFCILVKKERKSFLKNSTPFVLFAFEAGKILGRVRTFGSRTIIRPWLQTRPVSLWGHGFRPSKYAEYSSRGIRNWRQLCSIHT